MKISPAVGERWVHLCVFMYTYVYKINNKYVNKINKG